MAAAGAPHTPHGMKTPTTSDRAPEGGEAGGAPRPLLTWSAPVREELCRRARRAFPREACGLLLGRRVPGGAEIVEAPQARNRVVERAGERFDLAPEDWVAIETRAREAGLEVVGVWHTHPDRPARPSSADRESAWEGYAWLIASVGAEGVRDVRSWRLVEGTFVEEDLREAPLG